ncbi:MAG: PAS domain-containing protein, partial [Desulfobacterales bacterium]|nr:PAS domain-containing protein [Desulfobacterales bacterium]
MSLKRTSTKEKTFQVNGHSVHVNAHNELLYFIQNPILAINPQRIITYANRATQDIAGKTLEEIIGKGVCEILHGEFCP